MRKLHWRETDRSLIKIGKAELESVRSSTWHFGVWRTGAKVFKGHRAEQRRASGESKRSERTGAEPLHTVYFYFSLSRCSKRGLACARDEGGFAGTSGKKLIVGSGGGARAIVEGISAGGKSVEG